MRNGSRFYICRFGNSKIKKAMSIKVRLWNCHHHFDDRSLLYLSKILDFFITKIFIISLRHFFAHAGFLELSRFGTEQQNRLERNLLDVDERWGWAGWVVCIHGSRGMSKITAPHVQNFTGRILCPTTYLYVKWKSTTKSWKSTH